MSYLYLKTQIDEVKSDIKQLTDQMGLSDDAVTLLGVTKTYEADIINASIDYGITDIAENRVQEIIRKYDDVKKDVRWHLIGHLQTNKVKYIIDKVELIHSVDSLKLAEEISLRASKINKVQNILIQVNVADESQKYGVSVDEAPKLIADISKLSNIKICGLMNIAPLVDNVECLREDFKTMKRLFDSVQSQQLDNVEMIYLSMGMSNDYKVAIEEGSNMIRIGTKIYGKRN